MNTENLVEICKRIAALDSSLGRLRATGEEASPFILEEYAHALEQEIRLLKDTVRSMKE